MKLLKTIILLLAVCVINKVHSQNLFPEKFEGCNTDQFALESDSTTAKIEDEKLLSVLMKALDEKTKGKIRGTLSLQIIVNLEGNSCLISLKNETNIKTKKLKLKQAIDSDLLWDKPKKKVAAIIVFYFDEMGVSFKRLGFNANKGAHELKD